MASSNRLVLTVVEEVDEEVKGWLCLAYATGD
jgi:hypothetical protein